MSETARSQAGADDSLLAEVLGRNSFDDRVDTQPDVTTREALALIGRCMALLMQARALLSAKLLLGLVLLAPGLLLPWLAKVVVDQALLDKPFGGTEVVYPPFMDPIIALAEGKDALGIMLTVSSVYFAMLLLTGIGRGTGSSLLQGQDAATQAENAISQGYSSGSGLLGIAEFMVHVRLTQLVANRLRSRLFERIGGLPMTVLDDQRIGDSIYRVLYDAPSAPGLAYGVTVVPFFMAIGALLNLWILQYSYGAVTPELVWIAWATVPAAFITTYPFSGALRRTNQNKRAAGAATTNSMEESVSNAVAVQSLGAGRQQREAFETRSAQGFLRERYALGVIIAVSLIAFSALGAAALYVAIVITDDIIVGVLTPGDFAVVLGVFWGIVIPAGYFGGFWIKLQDAIAAVRRVFFFLDHPVEHEAGGSHHIASIEQGVEMRGVGFDYPDGKTALDDINLTLRIGSLVAFVGPTGAGKTSLAYLVPALLRPTRGQVLIDGIDSAEIDIDSLRRKVTYVFQEHVLLSESIRDNLLLANADATEAQIVAALDTAGCSDFVSALPDGLDTVLGRAGDTLSVGQQQRLSIVRGLVRNTPVMIFDEPTAALDPETENQLVASLHKAARDRLVIVIAHRLSTIRQADQIVFLKDGAVCDVGVHDVLMADPASQYREFVELQNG